MPDSCFLLEVSVTLLAGREIHSFAHHEESVAEIVKVLTEDCNLVSRLSQDCLCFRNAAPVFRFLSDALLHWVVVLLSPCRGWKDEMTHHFVSDTLDDFKLRCHGVNFWIFSPEFNNLRQWVGLQPHCVTYRNLATRLDEFLDFL